ncbi:hypothetical protein YC2023_053697 [Brassica napus]
MRPNSPFSDRCLKSLNYIVEVACERRRRRRTLILNGALTGLGVLVRVAIFPSLHDDMAQGEERIPYFIIASAIKNTVRFNASSTSFVLSVITTLKIDIFVITSSVLGVSEERGELNSLAVNVVLGLVALARGVLLSRGVEIVINGSFEAASSPSVHPFSSFGLVFFCNLFRALSTGFYWVCALLCVLAGSVPPVQLLMSRLTYFRFSEKASDEESKLFLVTGVWIFRWIRRLGDASQ